MRQLLSLPARPALALALALIGCGGESTNDGGAASGGTTTSVGSRYVGCDAEPRWVAADGTYAERRGYLGFSADGARIAWSYGFYESVRLELDSASGTELSRFTASAEQPPRNELLGLDAGWQRELLGNYELWINEPATGQSRTCAGGAYGDVAHATLSEDGFRVFRASCNGADAGWDVLDAASGELAQRITLATTCGESSIAERAGDLLLTADDVVAFVPSGQTSPSASATHEHALVDGVLRGIVGAAIDDARTRAVTIAIDGSVQVYDLPGLAPHMTALSARVSVLNQNAYAPTFRASPVAFSHDGSTLAFVSESGELLLLRAATLEEVGRIPAPVGAPAITGHDGLALLAFSPDDLTLVVSGEVGLHAYSCALHDG